MYVKAATAILFVKRTECLLICTHCPFLHIMFMGIVVGNIGMLIALLVIELLEIDTLKDCKEEVIHE